MPVKEANASLSVAVPVAASTSGSVTRIRATSSATLPLPITTARPLEMSGAISSKCGCALYQPTKSTAATLPGMQVEISATVTAVEGRKVSFEFSARDELEPIGGGTHTRFVVDVAKTFERLKAKAAKCAAAKAT